MVQILSEGSYSNKKNKNKVCKGFNSYHKINIATYFKILIIGLHILNILTRMSSSVPIRCYLLSDPKFYFYV